MPSCCYDDEYDKMFTGKEAARTAARFRRRGLRGSAADLSAAIESVATPGALMIEVGGGAGQIQIALLEAGVAAKSLNIELSDNWEEAASTLIEEHALSDRVERRIGDFVDQSDELPVADVVVMHRVICCYPHWRAMLTSASRRSKAVVGITVPVYRWWTRLMVAVENLSLRLRHMQFRAFVHPTQPMIQLMEAAGFAVVHDHASPVWRTIVFQRPSH